MIQKIIFIALGLIVGFSAFFPINQLIFKTINKKQSFIISSIKMGVFGYILIRNKDFLLNTHIFLNDFILGFYCGIIPTIEKKDFFKITKYIKKLLND